MKLHGNARTCPKSRELIASRVSAPDSLAVLDLPDATCKLIASSGAPNSQRLRWNVADMGDRSAGVEDEMH